MSAPSVRWRFVLGLLHRLPQGMLSRATGRLADLPVPRMLRGPVIGGFARIVGVNQAEAESDPRDYPSVGAYFVRRLQPGVRSWPRDPQVVTSPVDGVVGAVGRIEDGTVLQAKGMPYRVHELLGIPEGSERAGAYEGGRFVTLYLSPRHYHRIHAPASGEIRVARSLPGRLLPVNEPAIQGVPRLFPRNERLVVEAVTPGGPLALVAVGAFNVGRISVAFDPEWNGLRGRGVTNRPGRPAAQERRYAPPLELRRGEELAAFHLGSTVVLLLGPDGAGGGPALAPSVVPGADVLLGNPLTLGADAPGA
jgi:phosphatidylserine decarboxylase